MRRCHAANRRIDHQKKGSRCSHHLKLSYIGACRPFVHGKPALWARAAVRRRPRPTSYLHGGVGGVHTPRYDAGGAEPRPNCTPIAPPIGVGRPDMRAENRRLGCVAARHRPPPMWGACTGLGGVHGPRYRHGDAVPAGATTHRTRPSAHAARPTAVETAKIGISGAMAW